MARSKKRRLNLQKITLLLITLGVMFVLCAWLLYQKTVYGTSDLSAGVWRVESGDTYYKLLNKFGHHGFVMPVAKFYLKLKNPAPLTHGNYHIPAGASLDEVVRILQQGAAAAQVRVQIVEGKSVKDLFLLLKNTDGIKLELLTPATGDYPMSALGADSARVASALGLDYPKYPNLDAPVLEGLFAPDTYFFAQNTSDKEILQKLYDTQMARLNEAYAKKTPNLPYKNAYEALIMASIIEKETGVADERPLVASVFVNRLRQNMRLQTDPTIIYGLFDRYDGKIYKSNISEKTAYNTYQIDGLPPTPIALPSRAAINAALNPSQSEAIYFVATGTGGHKFSKTLDEHNAAVALYRAKVAQ